MKEQFEKTIVVLDNHVDDTTDFVIRQDIIHPPSIDFKYKNKGADVYPSFNGEIKNNKFIINTCKGKMIVENAPFIIFYGGYDEFFDKFLEGSSHCINLSNNLFMLPLNKKEFNKYDLHVDPDCLNKQAIMEICLRNNNPIIKNYFKNNGYVINPCYLGVFGNLSKNDFDAFFRNGIGNLFIGEVFHPIYERKLVELNKIKFDENTVIEAGKELVSYILERYFKVVNSKTKVFLLDTLGINKFKSLEEVILNFPNVNEIIFENVAEKELSEKIEIRDDILKEGKAIVISPCHDGAGYLMEDMLLSNVE